MAAHLQHQDLVWHPEHGVMMVLEVDPEALREHPLADVLDRDDGVWCAQQGTGLFEDQLGRTLVPILDLKWFEERELARVGWG